MNEIRALKNLHGYIDNNRSIYKDEINENLN
jgi:hypothetical protein